MDINFVFQIAILIISVMAHEIAHGATAFYFGDPTAKNQGRLTLNPLKHIDLFGSLILPLVLFITNVGFIFAWAKPVPYNPYNLRNRRLGEFCVSIAGIITNLLIAIIFAVIIRLAVPLGLPPSALELLAYIVFLNLILGVFNLIPVPPLDGSKILFSLIPYRFERQFLLWEKYGLYFLIFFIAFFGWIISDLAGWLFRLMV